MKTLRRESFERDLREVWNERAAPGAVVLVTLTNPAEKVWGILLELRPEGINMSASPLNAVEGLIEQARQRETLDLPMLSVFYPMHRVERIDRDDQEGSLSSFYRRFRESVGVTVQEYVKRKRG